MPQAQFQRRWQPAGRRDASAQEIQHSAIIASLLSLFGILVYVAFRYEFSFAVAAVVAVIHDVLLTIGVYCIANAMSGREFNATVVAAVLTIIGFSINDKIVIFDRIREDLKLGVRGTFKEIINQALNQTLSRTIITCGTVFLATLSLYIFGGGVINDFAFTFLVGIITGTYSSIYIASAIVLWWHKGERPNIGASAVTCKTPVGEGLNFLRNLRFAILIDRICSRIAMTIVKQSVNRNHDCLIQITPWHWAGFILSASCSFSRWIWACFIAARASSNSRKPWRGARVWFALAMLFAGVLAHARGREEAAQFTTGYLIELSLSLDNILVIALIFSAFRVPPQYQHRVLFWGILGALVMRGAMIAGGAALIRRFELGAVCVRRVPRFHRRQNVFRRRANGRAGEKSRPAVRAKTVSRRAGNLKERNSSRG